jgi:hypothetical protein
MQYWRKNNIEKSTYLNLKNNAKRRGKDFDLDFKDFCKFANKFSYFAGKGIKKESLHIDRINEKLGYTIENIQILTNSENAVKWLDYYYDEIKRKMIFKFKKNEYTKKSRRDNECPF